MSTLHITNGDGAADLLKASTIGGDVLPWRDPMHHGPFPTGLGLSELSVIRADYLSGPHNDTSAARRSFQERDDQLRNANRYDGVPDFRGLGNLTPEQVATLWDVRRPVTRDQLHLARGGWRAFRSPDPRELERFLLQDLSGLPFLGRALRRHLQDYPWLKDGLTRTERQILELVADGTSAPGLIFVENMNQEDVLFMGDWSTYRHIDLLCRAKSPLLNCAPDPEFQCPPQMTITREEFLAQRLTLSEYGRRVLAGDARATDMIERDMWLGGVRLRSDQPLWMWEDDNDRLELIR